MKMYYLKLQNNEGEIRGVKEENGKYIPVELPSEILLLEEENNAIRLGLYFRSLGWIVEIHNRQV